MSIAAHGRNARTSTSQYAAGRNHRREVKIREYLLAQPNQSSGAPAYDTAVHVIQSLGFHVSDKRAHEWWCSLFDMIQSGQVIEEPREEYAVEMTCRLATTEELQARLGIQQDPATETAIVMLAHQKEAGK